MNVSIAQEVGLLTTQLRLTRRAHPLRLSLLALLRWLWLPYLLASVLILVGFRWGLPDDRYLDMSFQADENAAVWAVNQIGFPFFYPRGGRGGPRASGCQRPPVSLVNPDSVRDTSATDATLWIFAVRA